MSLRKRPGSELLLSKLLSARSKNRSRKIMRYCGRCKRNTEHYLFNGRMACKLCAFKRTN